MLSIPENKSLIFPPLPELQRNPLPPPVPPKIIFLFYPQGRETFYRIYVNTDTLKSVLREPLLSIQTLLTSSEFLQKRELSNIKLTFHWKVSVKYVKLKGERALRGGVHQSSDFLNKDKILLELFSWNTNCSKDFIEHCKFPGDRLSVKWDRVDKVKSSAERGYEGGVEFIFLEER